MSKLFDTCVFRLVDSFSNAPGKPDAPPTLRKASSSMNPTVQHSDLYTAAERERRDASVWTMVQGILAPAQLLVCLISLALVLHYLRSGEHAELAAASVVLKTLFLYTIMVTGSLWEKEVFGRWLFARPFFWEDVVSMGVIALHTAYLVLYLGNIGSPHTQFTLALIAYSAYFINAAQFLYKLRLARQSAPVVAGA